MENWQRLECGALKDVFSLVSIHERSEVSGLVFGFVADGKAVCKVFFPVRNILDRPDKFEMDPWSVVVAHLAMEKYGLKLVAVYHTHPCGEPVPSFLDLRGMKAWPVPWIILGRTGLKAWRLHEGKIVEVELA